MKKKLSPPSARARGAAAARRGARAVLTPALAAVLACSALVLPGTPAAADSTGTVDVQIVQTSDAVQPTGSVFKYTLSFSCSVLSGSECLTGGVITIPLGAAAEYEVEFPAALPDGVLSAEVVDGEIVLTLEDVGSQADAISIEFFITSAIGVPNGTAWQLIPTVTGEGTEPVIGNSVDSSVTAKPAEVSVSKIPTGDKTYAVGQTVTWSIVPKCHGGEIGTEYPTSFTLVDPIPEGLEFVPSAGWVYDEATRTVTRAGLRPACDREEGLQYLLSTRVTDALHLGDTVTNEVTLQANWPDESSVESTADAEIRIIEEETPTGTLYKRSIAPLRAEPDTAGGNWRGTYAGNWGSDVSSYYAGIRGYGSKQSVLFTVTDDFPCLDEAPQAAFVYETRASGLCAHPAWHLTSLSYGNLDISAPMPDAKLTLIDGSVVTTPFVRAEYRWVVPASAIGKVARAEVGDVTSNRGKDVSNIWFNGYPDESLAAGDVLRNTAKVSVRGTGFEVSGKTNTADLYVLDQPQIDIEKSGERVKGKNAAEWSVNATVLAPRMVNDAIIITDLMPEDVENVSAPGADGEMVPLVTGGNAQVTLRLEGADPVEVSAPVEVLPNHRGTGRTLVRWKIAPEQVRGLPGYGGDDVPIGLFIQVHTHTGSLPYAGDYTNDAAVFFNPGARVDYLCMAENAAEQDPLDLDGRPAVQKHCTASATVALPPGPGTSKTRLIKEVKGDLDTAFMRDLAVGKSSQRAGAGQYRLTWENRDQTAVNDVVLYDILPYVGDTGVKESMAGQGRGSEAATEFLSLETLPAGVEVAYSQSTNPCRDRVLPDAKNLECDDDWSTAVPADASTVRALRFVSNASYDFGQGFQVVMNVRAPVVEHGEIAWNSVASAQTIASSGVALPTLEAPKVGLTRLVQATPVIEIAKNDRGDDRHEVPLGVHTVTVTITNTGDDDLTDLVFEDQTTSGADVVWNEEELAALDGLVLAPGGTVQITGVVEVGERVPHADLASITATGVISGRSVSDADPTTLVPEPVDPVTPEEPEPGPQVPGPGNPTPGNPLAETGTQAFPAWTVGAAGAGAVLALLGAFVLFTARRKRAEREVSAE